MDLDTVSHFATQNHRKSQNCAQSESEEAPQIHSKIIKNGHPDLTVSIGCPPGPQDHQNGVPGTPKGASRSPKSVLGGKNDPFQQSTCQQLPVDKGPAAGGEALKYITAQANI